MWNPTTLLASSGWWRSKLPYTLYLLPLTFEYTLDHLIPYTFFLWPSSVCHLAHRPYGRRPNVFSISREVWGIVLPTFVRPTSLSVLACKRQTLKRHICIVRCRQSACSKPAKKNGQVPYLLTYLMGLPLHYAILTYLPYEISSI